MGLTQLAEMCKSCSFNEQCKKKKMEGLCFIAPITACNLTEDSSRLLRETTKINVNGDIVFAYKDDLERQIKKSLFTSMLVNLGGS